MTLCEIDPLTDDRWVDLAGRSSNGSIFHTRAWLTSLRRTYGYEPVAFTTTRRGECLRNGIVFCRVASWMTGRRLVSLPFSDHCDPLVETSEEFRSMLDSLGREQGQASGRYIEVRPRRFSAGSGGFERAAHFCLQVLDLRRPSEDVFAGFHKSCVQRAIRKAEREGVECEVGATEPLVMSFYRLHALTRRKHGAPLQPLAWFRNLVDNFGDRLRIYAARHQGALVSAILTLAHQRAWVYKYGCSDPQFNSLGATPFLFWNAIRDAQRDGATEFDLGRSDADDAGLIAFKEHFGAKCSTLTYYRCAPRSGRTRSAAWTPALAKRAYGLVPGIVRDRVGSHFYRHFA